MRRISLLLLGLLVPSIASAAQFAYERDIIIPPLSQETSVWVPLDPHALLERMKGYEIADGAAAAIPFKQLNETVNLLRGATIDAAPAAATTVPQTSVEDMVDGNPETSFQPEISKEITFRFHFDTPVTPTRLVFQLSSGWIEHIRVRIGSSASTLHDAFVGTPSGTNIPLSGEVASVVEVTVRTSQGVLRISEASLLAPSTKLLLRAQPGQHYVLRYGTLGFIEKLPATTVFTDIHAITGSLGPVRALAGGPDAEKDGIPDDLDNCPQKANPDQRDFDHDGIGDTCDNAPSVPNVAQSDRDKDGVGDEQDNCPYAWNPDQRDDDFNDIGWTCDDVDGDGTINGKDNCVGLANADQQDLNNNKIGDACEDDRDQDGVPAKIDNCKTTFNPEQSDEDADGIGDACDDCPYLYDPKQIDRNGDGIGDACQQPKTDSTEPRDRDGDGIPDAKDNCPTVRNQDQSEQDNDGIGDACDNCPALQNTDQRDSNQDGMGDVCTDSDGDGVLDPYDNCIAYANPKQGDRNQNGIGDPCDDDDGDRVENARDNCAFDSNTLQADEDMDGIGNPCDKTDDRWSEQRPWLLYGSIVTMVVVLTGLGAFILKKSEQ